MTDCSHKIISFPALKRRRIEAAFTGGRSLQRPSAAVESDRSTVDRAILDPRDQRSVSHCQISLLRQRIYGLALGYEDLNDHDQLRSAPALISAVACNPSLGSATTRCRLAHRRGRSVAVALHAVMIEPFIASFKPAPSALILAFDATDDRVHGNQKGRPYHGGDRPRGFLPRSVFVGDQ